MRRYHRVDRGVGDRLSLELSREELERLLREELHTAALQIGQLVIGELFEEEVFRICGKRRCRQQARQAHRYGHQGGSIVLGGQRVRMRRPRMRTADGRREVPLTLYEQLQREDVVDQAVMKRLIRGVSCRGYRSVIDLIGQSVGWSRSAVSRRFVANTTRIVAEFERRRFSGVRFAAIFIDGVQFSGETVVIALGVTSEGSKRVLAVRPGATENARVCTDLLEDLRERGVSTELPTLFVLDGSRALRGAVVRVWGDGALIQRCRVHKIRNVQAYVPETMWLQVAQRIRDAYGEQSYAKAKRSLETTIRWLDRTHPQAAASLREGLEETLTVTKLKLDPLLKPAFQSTNLIESAIGRVRDLAVRVKRWKTAAMRVRWCVAALLDVESRFDRVHGCRHMPRLIAGLDRYSTLAMVAVA